MIGKLLFPLLITIVFAGTSCRPSTIESHNKSAGSAVVEDELRAVIENLGEGASVENVLSELGNPIRRKIFKDGSEEWIYMRDQHNFSQYGDDHWAGVQLWVHDERVIGWKPVTSITR